MNIIRNGGFESGTLRPGWRQTPGTAPLDGGVTDAVDCIGNYCLELRGADFVEQTFFMASTTGDLTFRARVEDEATTGPVSVRIEYLDGSISPHLLTQDLSDSWKEFRFPVNDSEYLSKIEFGAGETTAVYIDDVYLEGVRIYPASIEEPLYQRNVALRRVLYPYDSPWFMMQLDTLEKQMQFKYNSTIEDRLMQIETQLAKLTSMLPTKP